MFTDLKNPSVISFEVVPKGKGFTVKLKRGGDIILTFEGKPVSFQQAFMIGCAISAAAKLGRKS